jgi:predicted aconitase with swiveling domain
MKSWKTTASGVIAVLVAVASAAEALINGRPVDWATVAAAVMAGIGLIFAKDSNVTGGSVTQ